HAHVPVEREVAGLEPRAEAVELDVDRPDLAAADQTLGEEVVTDRGRRLALGDLERDLLGLVGGGDLGLVRVPAVGRVGPEADEAEDHHEDQEVFQIAAITYSVSSSRIPMI